jgi:hypothetical protein
MAIVTLNAIIGKIRRLTGSSDPLQLPDTILIGGYPYATSISDYINSFYSYDFPSEFRSLKLKDVYSFNTVQGIDVYPFNSEQYTTVEMPCYCMKREMQLFNDPWSFYGVNYNWQTQTNFDYGDNSSGPYSGFLSAIPLIRSVNNNPSVAATPNITPQSTNGVTIYPTQGYSGYPVGRVQNVLITANTSTGTVNVTDDGLGNLIGDCYSGTINYQTGEISNLIFGTVSSPISIPSGNFIQCQYNPVQESIPLSIMFFQNQFTVRPVPDQGYTIELIAYRQPSQALLTQSANTGTPELSEWWECIAIGASKKIFEDRLDMDGAAMMDKMLQERYQIAYTRTYAQLGKQRVNTIYQDQLAGNYAGSGFGFGSGGSI